MADAVAITLAGPVSIAGVAERIRRTDRDEILAGSGREPPEALERSVRMSSHVWAGWINAEPAAVFGVGPLSMAAGIGCPWFVGAEVLERHPRPMIELSRDWLARIAALYPHLVNHVDARNAKAVRWLRWLGFTIHPAAPHGPLGMPFHRFTLGI